MASGMALGRTIADGSRENAGAGDSGTGVKTGEYHDYEAMGVGRGKEGEGPAMDWFRRRDGEPGEWEWEWEWGWGWRPIGAMEGDLCGPAAQP
jgi:hypothetical protein